MAKLLASTTDPSLKIMDWEVGLDSLTVASISLLTSPAVFPSGKESFLTQMIILISPEVVSTVLVKVTSFAVTPSWVRILALSVSVKVDPAFIITVNP